MLSVRGAQWAKISFAHGEQDTYSLKENPKGIVSFGFAENVSSRKWDCTLAYGRQLLMHDDISTFINTHVRRLSPRSEFKMLRLSCQESL